MLSNCNQISLKYMSSLRDQTKTTMLAALQPFMVGGIGGKLSGSLDVQGQFVTTDGKFNNSLLIQDVAESSAIKLSASGTTLQIGSTSEGSVQATIDPVSGTIHWPGVFTSSRIDSGELDADQVRSTSDERLKSDIVNFDCDLSRLHAKRYILDTDGKYHVGLIAQTVKKAIPDAVATRSDGYYTLDYNAIVAVLVNKVNDLQRQIDRLKAGAAD